ncbi:hypothetical protein, partial [Aeromonas caviae]|uniref:hypothetical protein n=1 Tax=Aeromonas caviae TaxID=648 RepID=UPI001CC74AEE
TALKDQVQGQRQRTLALLLRLRAGRRQTRRQLRKARAQLLDAAELGGWEAVTSLLDSLEKPPKSGPIAASG